MVEVRTFRGGGAVVTETPRPAAAYDRSDITAASRGKGAIMVKPRPHDPLLETDMCIAELARHFGVSRYRIQEVKEWRLVKFRPGVRGGFDAWLAKPIQFLDVPVYLLGQAAKIIGLKSSRTLNRWCKAGHIQLTPNPRSGRFYVTPRQLIEAKRFKESRHGGRKPDPENLLRQLAKYARRDGGPPVDNPRKLWPRRY